MTQQEAQKQANDEMLKFGDETHQTVSKQFDEWKEKVFAFHSPSTLKLDPIRFFGLLKQGGQYTLNQFMLLLPAMENKSMRQLDMEADEYESYQLEVFEVSMKVKTTFDKESERLNRKYSALIASSPDGANELKGNGKKTMNFPTKKAEA